MTVVGTDSNVFLIHEAVKKGEIDLFTAIDRIVLLVRSSTAYMDSAFLFDDVLMRLISSSTINEMNHAMEILYARILSYFIPKTPPEIRRYA